MNANGTAGAGWAALKNGQTGDYNGVSFSNNYGAGNTTWDNMEVDINFGAASNAAVSVYRNGTLVSSYSDSRYETAPSGPFGNYNFYISVRGGTQFGFVGYIDNLTIASVPEPSSCVLVVGALIGLLAYAWRKRK